MCSDETASDQKTVIRVSDLTKDYRIFNRPRDRLLQKFSRRSLCQHHRALDQVSFAVSQGEVVGILGRNGSGKSTLLQILCGVLQPSSGSVEAQGKIAALLELGAGFNPEFTGIENVYLNASILGLTQDETKQRLDDILAFADIGEFVHQPVKIYSSGMHVRLAFAVAACVDPDILIVDEALAVGDVQFQSKCFRHFERLVASGKTVLLVSHSTEQVVRHCSRALLLENGQLMDDGEPRDMANRYIDLLLGTSVAEVQARARAKPDTPAERAVNGGAHNLPVSRLEQRSGYSRSEYRWGQGGGEIRDVMASRDGDSQHRVSFDSGRRITISVSAVFNHAAQNVIFGFFIKTPDGVTVYGNSTRNTETGAAPIDVVAGQRLVARFGCDLNLGGGSYLLSVGISKEVEGEIIPIDRRYDCLQFEVINGSGSVGLAELYAVCHVGMSDLQQSGCSIQNVCT